MSKFRALPRTEILVLLVMLFIFTGAFGLSFTFIPPTDSYPRAISGIGMCLVVLELAVFAYQTYRHRQNIATGRQEAASILNDIQGILPYVIWLLLYFLLIYIIGLIIASGIFAFLFLLLIGRVRWYYALLGGFGALVATFLVSDILVLALPEAVFDVFQEYRNILSLPF